MEYSFLHLFLRLSASLSASLYVCFAFGADNFKFHEGGQLIQYERADHTREGLLRMMTTVVWRNLLILSVGFRAWRRVYNCICELAH